jgi:hypothetical protein
VCGSMVCVCVLTREVQPGDAKGSAASSLSWVVRGGGGSSKIAVPLLTAWRGSLAVQCQRLDREYSGLCWQVVSCQMLLLPALLLPWCLFPLCCIPCLF